MCGAIEKAGVNSVLDGDLLENKRSHIRSLETPVEPRGGTTGSKGQLISFFAADFKNDFQAFSWRFLNSATSI